MEFAKASTGSGEIRIHLRRELTPLNTVTTINTMQSRNKVAQNHRRMVERFRAKYHRDPQVRFGMMRHYLHCDDQTVMKIERETGITLIRGKGRQ